MQVRKRFDGDPNQPNKRITAIQLSDSGEIRADGVVVGANGEILLRAKQNVTLENGSVISASGPTAGTVGRSTASLMSCPLDRSQVSSASGRSRRMPRNPITTAATKICKALRDESAAAFSARA